MNLKKEKENDIKVYLDWEESKKKSWFILVRSSIMILKGNGEKSLLCFGFSKKASNSHCYIVC
jgi:hypothetical protein